MRALQLFRPVGKMFYVKERVVFIFGRSDGEDVLFVVDGWYPDLCVLARVKVNGSTIKSCKILSSWNELLRLDSSRRCLKLRKTVTVLSTA